MEELSEEFPPGLEHRIIYNPTEYVADSINQVYHTLFEAGLLVVLTVFVFLQNWRSVIIPLVAIPVSLIGTFAAMHAIGFSLNSLSLFGLVLAAMCAIFLKPEGAKPNVLDRASKFLFGWFFRAFNRAFDFSNNIYAGTVRRLLRVSAIALLFYAGLLGMTWFSFDRVPMGFIPAQDRGYFIISLELPSASSLARTDEVTKRIRKIALETPGVGHAVSVVGFCFLGVGRSV